MSRKVPVLLFLLATVFTHAQHLELKGNMMDTAQKTGLPNVLMMAIRFNDSTLIQFSHSDNNGLFTPIQVPLDTYLVILSHPGFNDKTYLLAPSPSDTAFNFKNVVLPPKSIELNEVEIIAHKEKSFYKGDTLIFTADSFKTLVNATVEDLLKKLPGVRVDAKGKITIQGKEVDQVLVDGDEFFGSDPTVATRNLNASTVDNVQVYDKKNESTEEGQKETLKVVNLKLKDSAKKGYFGKASGATDFNKFYENELLANQFQGSRKISVFGIMANTPKQAFGWDDANKYGLSGEQPYSYDDQTGNWTSNNNTGTGIPKTIKTGFYFNDKLSKNTKLNMDYTYNQNQLQSGTQTNTQFFLQDTSYTNARQLTSLSKNQSHGFNLRLTQKLDSLTELVVAPKIKYNSSDMSSLQTDQFISKEGILTRQTSIQNTTKNTSTDVNVLFKLTRNFMKKDRVLTLTYQPVYSAGSSSTTLNTDFVYYQGQSPDSSLNQQRTQSNSKLEHNAALVYVEPFTKKFKTEVSYSFLYNHNANNRKTYDYNGQAYNDFDPSLSNDFDNKRMTNRLGTKLIYDVKKYKVTIGSYFRNVQQQNINLTTDQKLNLNVNNVLPLASFIYRINQGSNFNAIYSSSSQQPDLQQMQPVRDNSDPNRIVIGNPNLRPTFTNNLNVNYYFYKGISDVNFYGGLGGNNTNNQISYATRYDSLGRAVSQPVNLNGNYSVNLYLGGGFPLFKRFMKMYYNFNTSHNNTVSLVNGIRNISQNSNFNPGITLEKTLDKFTLNLSGNYTYSRPISNISVQSSQPYYMYNLQGSVMIKLPKKFTINSDGNYTNNGNRSPGYNLNFFIWNASLSKAFLKSENLVVSFNANDMLNQSISNQRYISSNQIVDTKTQIIRRYFLFKILYRFNSQKAKLEEDGNE